MTEIEIVERPPALVLGVPVIGEFADLARLVPDAWRTVRRRTGTTGQELAEVSVDLGDGRYHETVGLLVDATDEVPPAGMVGTLVPGGAWVQTRHDDAADRIAGTFGRLLDWLAAHDRDAGPHKLDMGYRLDGGTEHHVLAVQLG